jgi:hypothetical protein
MITDINSEDRPVPATFAQLAELTSNIDAEVIASRNDRGSLRSPRFGRPD